VRPRTIGLALLVACGVAVPAGSTGTSCRHDRSYVELLGGASGWFSLYEVSPPGWVSPSARQGIPLHLACDISPAAWPTRIICTDIRVTPRTIWGGCGVDGRGDGVPQVTVQVAVPPRLRGCTLYSDSVLINGHDVAPLGPCNRRCTSDIRLDASHVLLQFSRSQFVDALAPPMSSRRGSQGPQEVVFEATVTDGVVLTGTDTVRLADH
jgi:hypothetical protein